MDDLDSSISDAFITWLSLVLFASRSTLLIYLKTKFSINPIEWLIFQIYYGNHIFKEVFNKFLKYDYATLYTINNLLFPKDKPFIIMDEAQAFMAENLRIFLSSEPNIKKPLLSKVIYSAKIFKFRILVSGTHLSLIHIAELYSSVGGKDAVHHHYNFDYLKYHSSEDKSTVFDFLSYFLDFSNVDKSIKENISYTLQGKL